MEAAEWKRAVKAIQFWEMAAEEAMEGIDHHQVGVRKRKEKIKKRKEKTRPFGVILLRNPV